MDIETKSNDANTAFFRPFPSDAAAVFRSFSNVQSAVSSSFMGPLMFAVIST
jgi:hypothetical protein